MVQITVNHLYNYCRFERTEGEINDKCLRVTALILVVITAVFLQIIHTPPYTQAAAFLLLAILPALSWQRWLHGTLAERLLSAAALVLLLNAILALLLSYLPGAINRPFFLAVYALSAALPLFGSGGKMGQNGRFAFTLRPFILIFALAFLFRLPNIGYSEFQGDEGIIMGRAAAIITGDDGALFLHQKGPIEILEPLSIWQLAGQINETWSRLLFTWGSGLSVLAVMLLCWRWFGKKTGVMAALFFIIVGFSIAFGRIVQYQSFVMLWGILALYHADRYTDEEWAGDLWLTAVFLAGGLLAHYDAILVVPAIFWTLLTHLFRIKQIRWIHWLGAMAAGGFLLSAFYIPFVLNPNFARTAQYLLNGRVGGGGDELLRWGGTAVWQMATLYNSSYFIIGLIIFTSVAIAHLARKREGMATVLYLFAPIFFYLFVVGDPRTHIYTIFPAAVILTAVGINTLAGWVKAHPNLYRAAAILLFIWWAASAWYVHLIFIDHTPERVRNWKENRPAKYWTSWDEPPLYGLFGFPHQAGWRVVGDLVSADELPYASNEERQVTDWYMKYALRTHCQNFNSFMLAEQVQDVVPYDLAWLDGWAARDVVMVDGKVEVVINGRLPATPQTVEATGQQLWLTPQDATPSLPDSIVPLDITLGGGQVRLLGYELDTDHAVPNGWITAVLYWKSIAPFDENYQIFMHLNDGVLQAQHDGAPECNLMPTTHWEPNAIIADPHIVPLPADMPVGSIPLTVGMYNLLTQERLAVDSTDALMVYLDDVEIKEK